MEQQSSSSALEASPSSSAHAPSLEDVMRLLKGNTDSQRLAGLLLVTKFCDKNDKPTILSVYNAVGSTFLHRLLLTGICFSTAALVLFFLLSILFLPQEWGKEAAELILIMPTATLTCSSLSPFSLLLPDSPSLLLLVKCSLKSPLFWTFCPTSMCFYSYFLLKPNL